MKTEALKEVCSTFTSIIKENKIRPITSLVEISSKDGTASICATDNRTSIKAMIDNGNDIERAVVSLSDLSKLVKLTDKEEVTLNNRGRYVEFKGNGTYKLQIQTDEAGNELSLSVDMPKMCDTAEYMSDDFRLALGRNRVGLFDDDSHGEFKLYYNKNGSLITTDSITLACTNGVSLPLGDIQPFVIEQLSCLNGKIKLSSTDDGYIAECGVYQIYMVNKIYDKFPIDMIESFLDKKDSMLKNRAKIKKDLLIKAIKRQEIFNEVYYTPGIIFCVDSDIVAKNITGNAEENLEVTECEIKEKVESEIDTRKLLSVLKNMDNDIEILVGKRAVCVQDSKGYYIISILDRR